MDGRSGIGRKNEEGVMGSSRVKEEGREGAEKRRSAFILLLLAAKDHLGNPTERTDGRGASQPVGRPRHIWF